MSLALRAQDAPGRDILSPVGYVVRPFVGADYAALVDPKGAVDGSLLAEGQGKPLEVGRAYARFGRGYTALRDGEVIGCAGILRKWNGLGEAWLTLRPDLPRRDRLAVYRSMRLRFRALVSAMRMRRVEADVLREWGPGERLVIRLGFELESEMPLYGQNGETYGRWVLLSSVVLPFHVEP